MVNCMLMKILQSRSDAVAPLQAGAIGVLQTDTIYGLVAPAFNEQAVARLYALKEREKKPAPIIAATIDQLVELGIPRRYLAAVEQYWPNPLSVVVPAPETLRYLHQGTGTLAVRIPADNELREVLEKTGPLVATSANYPNEPAADSVQSAAQYFGDSVDFYVDTGTVLAGQPSTVVRVVDDAIEVLRQGSIRITESGEIQ